MGLAERRASKEFQDTQFPALKAEIVKVAGFDVPIEVSWEELAKEDQSGLYKESWPDLYFKPVIEGLRQITRDQMGKDAVKAALKKIVIRNSKAAHYAETAISFDNGVLEVDHDLSNVHDTPARIKYLVESVEKKL
jgi:hypothetical protein